MNKNNNKYIVFCFIFILSLLLNCFGAIADDSDNVTGKYVSFGTYRGDPVIYRVMGTSDENGDGEEEMFLMSQYVLTYKAYSPDNKALWSESSLRTWLNSDEETVEYADDKVPSLENGVTANPYHTEAGFMNGMTKMEKEAIYEVSHKTVVANSYSDIADGGTASWIYDVAFDTAYQNYDEAYYILTKDKVFIPSVGEIKKFNIESSFFMTGYASSALLDQDSGGKSYNMTRIRDALEANKCRLFTNPSGSPQITSREANLGPHGGIRTALYLKSDVELVGEGTLEAPCTIRIPFYSEVTMKYNGEESDELIDGEATFETTVNSSEQDKSISITYCVYSSNGTTNKLDYAEKDNLVLNLGENNISQQVLVSNSDSQYVKIYLEIDGKTSLLAKFGNETDVSAGTVKPGDNPLTVSSSVTNKTVLIDGITALGENTPVCVTLSDDTNSNEFCYYNIIYSSSDGRFKLEFEFDKLFTSGNQVDGWLKLTVSDRINEYSKTHCIAGNTITSKTVEILNSGNTDRIVGLLSNDAGYEDVYDALVNNGMEKLTDAALINDVAQRIIDNKPQEGYTASNYLLLIKKALLSSRFALSVGGDKYNVLESDFASESYSELENIIASDYYQKLKTDDAQAQWLDRTTDIADVKTVFIIKMVNAAENASDLKEAVEKYAGDIGITFNQKYNNLTASQYKTLYDKMLNTAFTGLTDIKIGFEKALDEIKFSESSPSGPSGTASKPSGSGKNGSFAVSGVVNTQKEISPKLKFSDISDLSYGKEAIEYLSGKGVINGISETLFAPTVNATREQAAKILSLAFNIEKDSTSCSFDDVDKDAWYCKYVSNLVYQGVINGIGNNKFGVGEYITREDLSVMIYRALIAKNIMLEIARADFDDYLSVSDYAKNAVNALTNAGIVNGYDDNTFKPERYVTRQEFSQLVYNTIKKYGLEK